VRKLSWTTGVEPYDLETIMYGSKREEWGNGP
jgi:hypothetical protein